MQSLGKTKILPVEAAVLYFLLLPTATLLSLLAIALPRPLVLPVLLFGSSMVVAFLGLVVFPRGILGGCSANQISGLTFNSHCTDHKLLH